MKKYTLFFVLFLLIVTNLTAAKIEKVYSFSNYSISRKGDFQTFSFDNSLLTGLPGQPILPYHQVKLLLPPGESVEYMEVIGLESVNVPGFYQLAPQQNVQPISKGASGVFIKDENVYKTNALYPATLSGEVMTSFLNGHSFALSTFTPVRYNPATGSVSYFSKVKVVVHTKADLKAAAALNNLKQTDIQYRELAKFADNAEMLTAYASDSKTSVDDYEILIITTPAFATSFETLRAAYLTEGLRSQVVTTNDISLSMTGVDLQEKMRNFIIQEYQQRNIQHVILGGDDELIPHRGFYCQVQSSSLYEDTDIPADLYFSALDGNWNTDGDNLWAEPGEDDLLPDISVGRLSFSNLIELQRMIHKTKSYQFTPVPGEFQKVLIAGENLYNGPETWGSDYLELLIGLRSDNGYTTNGIPESYSLNKMYDENTQWSGNDLINTLNQGYPMLDHVGHANETYAMKLSNSDITDLRFNNLNGTTHNYTLVYTHGCMCAAFDYPYDDCIAEKMVTINNFAVAFVGNSRYGWFNEGQTEGPSAHLNREFDDALYTDKLNRLGRAHMESKIATAPWVTAPGQWEPGALRWCFYDCNVLGDPAMAVWTNNALDISAAYPTSIPVGSSSISVTVNSAGFGVNGLNCVMMMNGNMLGKSVTNSLGESTIVFDAPVPQAGSAELFVSGYNCLPVAYPVTVDGNTGFSEPKSKGASLRILGNPVNEQLQFTYEHKATEIVGITLTSSEGKTRILKPAEIQSQGEYTLNCDASVLASGVYELTLFYGNMKETQRFIKK